MFERGVGGGGGGQQPLCLPMFFHLLMFTCVPLVYLFEPLVYLFEQLGRRGHIAFMSIYIYYNNIRAFIQSNSCLVCNTFRRHWCGLKNSSTSSLSNRNAHGKEKPNDLSGNLGKLIVNDQNLITWGCVLL